MENRIEYSQYLINKISQLTNSLEYIKNELYFLELDTMIAMLYLDFSGYKKEFVATI